METLGDWFYHHKTLLLALIIIVMSSIGGIFAMSKEDMEEENTIISDVSIKEELEEEPKEPEEVLEEKKLWSVDIKGEINKPGVYQVSENTRIYEIIEMAGGVTKNATTENINLSKKISDEMVIYIFSKEEYQKKIVCSVENSYEGEITKEITEKKSTIEENNDILIKDENKKISINQAKKEELMELEGIGEAKAESIIKYRIENGGFQTKEELQEVSGIGASLYEKIKDNITL